MGAEGWEYEINMFWGFKQYVLFVLYKSVYSPALFQIYMNDTSTCILYAKSSLQVNVQSNFSFYLILYFYKIYNSYVHF